MLLICVFLILDMCVLLCLTSPRTHTNPLSTHTTPYLPPTPYIHTGTHTTTSLSPCTPSPTRVREELHTRFASAILESCEDNGLDMFKIHPKGT